MANIISAKSETGHDVPAFVTPDGVPRLLTAIPGPPNRMATPFSAEPSRLIPRSEWREFDRRQSALPIYDQGQIGSCVANGWCYMLRRAMLTAGATMADVSRAMLYAMINGGRDAGADPAAAVSALSETGVCLESEVPYGFKVKRQISAGAYETAKRFRIEPDAVYSIANFDEAVSAELLGFDAGFTVFVQGQWNELSPDGCPPAYRGTGNHWMSFDNRLKKTSKGEWLLGALQSWGGRWGDGGRCWMREAHFANQPYLQMYAIRWPGQDPLDPNLAPVAA
jgi:hypothetical protein